MNIERRIIALETDVAITEMMLMCPASEKDQERLSGSLEELQTQLKILNYLAFGDLT